MGNWETESLTALDDARFVRRIVRRDVAAFEQLYDDLSPAIYGHLLQVTANQQAAEKLLVETFFRAWSQLPAFVGDRSALPGWLTGISNNLLERATRERRQGSIQAA